MAADNVSFGGVEEVIEELALFREAGVSDLMVRCMSVDEPDAIETIEHCATVRRALL